MTTRDPIAACPVCGSQYHHDIQAAHVCALIDAYERESALRERAALLAAERDALLRDRARLHATVAALQEMAAAKYRESRADRDWAYELARHIGALLPAASPLAEQYGERAVIAQRDAAALSLLARQALGVEET